MTRLDLAFVCALRWRLVRQMAMALSREIDAHIHEIPTWSEWELQHGTKASDSSWVSFGGGETYVPMDRVEEERRAADEQQRAAVEARGRLEAELRQKDEQVHGSFGRGGGGGGMGAGAEGSGSVVGRARGFGWVCAGDGALRGMWEGSAWRGWKG